MSYNHPYWMTEENTKGIPEVILQGYLYHQNKTREVREKQNGSRIEEEERKIYDAWGKSLLEFSQYLTEHPEEQQKLAKHFEHVKIDEVDWESPPDPPWMTEIIRKEVDSFYVDAYIDLYYSSPNSTRETEKYIFDRLKDSFPSEDQNINDIHKSFIESHPAHNHDRYEFLKTLAQEQEKPHQLDDFLNGDDLLQYWGQTYIFTRQTYVINEEFERNIMLVLSRTAPIVEPQKKWEQPMFFRSLMDNDLYYQYTWLDRCKLGILTMLITLIEKRASGLICKYNLPDDSMRATHDLFASKLQSREDDMEAVTRLIHMLHEMSLCDINGGAEYIAIGICRRALTKWAGMRNWYWDKSDELLMHDPNNKNAKLPLHSVKKQDFWPKRESLHNDLMAFEEKGNEEDSETHNPHNRDTAFKKENFSKDN